MNVPAPALVEVLHRTLDALRRGPAALAKLLRILASAEDLEVSDAELHLLLDQLLVDDANGQARICFHQRLADWDHVEAAAWAEGTPAHSAARRARIHALLAWSPERVTRCDAVLPVINQL